MDPKIRIIEVFGSEEIIKRIPNTSTILQELDAIASIFQRNTQLTLEKRTAVRGRIWTLIRQTTDIELQIFLSGILEQNNCL